MNTTALKRLLLLFWALWFSVVATTNILNGLQTLGVVPESFRFVSGNWQWINSVMDPLAVPRGLQGFLFVSVIVWESLSATLYWWALATFRGRPFAQERATIAACVVSLGLWSAFQVLDEVFMAYRPESVHRTIFLIQLVTILVLCLLPPTSEHNDGH